MFDFELLFSPYDFTIGVCFIKCENAIYIFPIPMIALKISFLPAGLNDS